jgi:hypothetical protein
VAVGSKDVIHHWNSPESRFEFDSNPNTASTLNSDKDTVPIPDVAPTPKLVSTPDLITTPDPVLVPNPNMKMYSGQFPRPRYVTGYAIGSGDVIGSSFETGYTVT